LHLDLALNEQAVELKSSLATSIANREALLDEVVKSVQSDRRAGHRNENAGRSADHCTDDKRSATDDHEGDVPSCTKAGISRRRCCTLCSFGALDSNHARCNGRPGCSLLYTGSRRRLGDRNRRGRCYCERRGCNE
jgi:hypothetical protein